MARRPVPHPVQSWSSSGALFDQIRYCCYGFGSVKQQRSESLGIPQTVSEACEQDCLQWLSQSGPDDSEAEQRMSLDLPRTLRDLTTHIA